MLIEAGWEMGKEVFCPRVEGKEMEFYRVKIWEDFESGAYGIREPKAECPVFESQSDDKVLIVLPGAVFEGTGSVTEEDSTTGIWNSIPKCKLLLSVLKNR